MPRMIKKTIQKTVTESDGQIIEKSITRVEITEEVEPTQVEKHTFFLDNEDEEEEWFKKVAEEDDDSVDIYILDDDKSW
jgi:hypothetical protein